MLSVLYSTFLSVAVKYGVGSHFLEIPKPHIYWLLFWLDHGLTCTILSVSLSKTSFAITLLRFAPQKWQRHTIWFVIISLNIVMTLVVVLQYAQCNPIEKRWDATLPGRCYDHHVIIYYSMFAGGTFTARLLTTSRLTPHLSLLSILGLRTCVAAMVDYLEPSNEHQGEDWSCSGNEPGSPVSRHFPLAMHCSFTHTQPSGPASPQC